jgi:predicted acylesterase/phospholipase RssA
VTQIPLTTPAHTGGTRFVYLTLGRFRAAVKARQSFGFLIFLTVASCGHVNHYQIPDLPSGTRNPPEYYEGLFDAPKLSICLSGGGYRAMLFHLGVLWRLNELGLLPAIEQVESVSGGSIVAAQLVLNWQKLHLIENRGVSPFFKTVVADPILRQANTTVDVRAVLAGVLVPGESPSSLVASALNGTDLFDGRTLSDLPAPPAPALTLVATDMESGLPWVFKKQFMGPEGPGSVRLHGGNVRIADAVAASAAFPPFLSPAEFKFNNLEQRFKEDETSIDPTFSEERQRAILDTVRRLEHLKLADGGLVNNLGSGLCESAATGILSDASNPVTRSKAGATWIGQYYRITNLIYEAKERRLRANVTDPTTHPNRIYLPLHRDSDADVPRDLRWIRDQIRVISHFVGGDQPSQQDQIRINRLESIIPDENAATGEGDYLRRYESIAIANKENTRFRKVKVAHVRALVNLGYVQASIMIAQYFVIAELNLIAKRGQNDPRDFERSTFWQEHSDQFREFMATIPEPVFTSKITLPCRETTSERRGVDTIHIGRVLDATEACNATDRPAFVGPSVAR